MRWCSLTPSLCKWSLARSSGYVSWRHRQHARKPASSRLWIQRGKIYYSLTVNIGVGSVWPCDLAFCSCSSLIVLAQGVASYAAETFTGSRRRLLELGAGCGMVSLAAAQLGFEVLSTDFRSSPLCLVAASARRQDLSKRVHTRLLDICDLSTPLPPADVVVAADVLYDARTAKAMAERVAEAHLRGSVVLLADVGRPNRRLFLSRLLQLLPSLAKRLPGFDFPIEGLAVQETDGAEVEHRHVPVQRFHSTAPPPKRSVLNSQYRAQILALQWLCQLRIVHCLMAPKKSAKRVIQVPEEDEPPAKKLLTSLKRHGIKESTYRHVADVFSHSAAAHLSQDCKDMFMAALPFSLLMASDERNTFQETVVGLVDKVVTEMLAGMQESLDKANEKLQLMDAEKARLDEAIQLAEDQLKAAQACACEKRAVVTAASAAVSAAQEKLSAAKEAEAAGQRARQAASDDKVMLQQAVSTGCFSRLKAGEWEDGEAERLFSSLEPLVLKKLKTDSSLRTAMRCTLLKKPVNRGQFDAMLLEELERAFSARISELESNLSEEGAVTAELAENVATANAEVETAMASQQQASAALSSSSSEEKMRAAALQAAKVTLQEFKPKHAQACSGRNAEQQQMQQFVDKNVAAFQELKDRVSIKSEKEMATGKELQANPTSVLGCEAGPEAMRGSEMPQVSETLVPDRWVAHNYREMSKAVRFPQPRGEGCREQQLARLGRTLPRQHVRQSYCF
ncbi:unnamed protein product [Symbiodinium necroappetens]|uniref:Uncharacterized protein n=1 Tax=Symbiodinium necroappetens TaxID=1628268 RepID=A0A812NK16_9DINO|nr:unnamed protein product [Symbiodinium necroappetens]